MLAIQKGNEEIALKLLERKEVHLNAKDKWGLTALHWACIMRLDKVIEQLIDHGAEINIVDLEHKSPYEYYVCHLFHNRDENPKGAVKQQMHSHCNNKEKEFYPFRNARPISLSLCKKFGLNTDRMAVLMSLCEGRPQPILNKLHNLGEYLTKLNEHIESFKNKNNKKYADIYDLATKMYGHLFSLYNDYVPIASRPNKAINKKRLKTFYN